MRHFRLEGATLACCGAALGAGEQAQYLLDADCPTCIRSMLVCSLLATARAVVRRLLS